MGGSDRRRRLAVALDAESAIRDPVWRDRSACLPALKPRAQRAVGSALAANHIGFLIPCHRVIRESGDTGNYRWGSERKLAMLAWEAGRANR